MEILKQIGCKLGQNWFVKKIKKYPLITFTIGIVFFRELIMFFLGFFTREENMLIDLGHKNIIPFIVFIWSFLIWLFIIWIASKFNREELKRKFFLHPIVTIIFLYIYIKDLFSRVEYNDSFIENNINIYNNFDGIIGIFSTIVSLAFCYFLSWLLVCWISSKIIKKQRFQWNLYKKIVEKTFILLPIIYKIILGLVGTLMLFFVIFILIFVVFEYQGRDLGVLFS